MTSSWRVFSSLSRICLLSSPTLSSMMVSSFFSFSSWSLQISSSRITNDDYDVNEEWRFGLHTTTFLLTSLCHWSFFLPLNIRRVAHSFPILLLLLPPAAGLLKLKPAGLLQTFLKDKKLSFNLTSVVILMWNVWECAICKFLSFLLDYFIFGSVMNRSFDQEAQLLHTPLMQY